MERASITPEEDARSESEREAEPVGDEDLDAFRDFVEGLDLEGLGGEL
jgi:hypothetical protein